MTREEMQRKAVIRLISSTPATPAWDGVVPMCSEECPHHDGKRCGLIGHRPGHICEPTVIGMGNLLEGWDPDA